MSLQSSNEYRSVHYAVKNMPYISLVCANNILLTVTEALGLRQALQDPGSRGPVVPKEVILYPRERHLYNPCDEVDFLGRVSSRRADPSFVAGSPAVVGRF